MEGRERNIEAKKGKREREIEKGMKREGERENKRYIDTYKERNGEVLRKKGVFRCELLQAAAISLSSTTIC